MHRLGRQIGRIGSHVGNETDVAFAGLDVDAFVERLRHLHRPAGREMKLVGGGLLQAGRRVGRRRFGARPLGFDRLHGECRRARLTDLSKHFDLLEPQVGVLFPHVFNHALNVKAHRLGDRPHFIDGAGERFLALRSFKAAFSLERRAGDLDQLRAEAPSLAQPGHAILLGGRL